MWYNLFPVKISQKAEEIIFLREKPLSIWLVVTNGILHFPDFRLENDFSIKLMTKILLTQDCKNAQNSFHDLSTQNFISRNNAGSSRNTFVT